LYWKQALFPNLASVLRKYASSTSHYPGRVDGVQVPRQADYGFGSPSKAFGNGTIHFHKEAMKNNTGASHEMEATLPVLTGTSTPQLRMKLH